MPNPNSTHCKTITRVDVYTANNSTRAVERLNKISFDRGVVNSHPWIGSRSRPLSFQDRMKSELGGGLLRVGMTMVVCLAGWIFSPSASTGPRPACLRSPRSPPWRPLRSIPSFVARRSLAIAFRSPARRLSWRR